MANTTEGDSTVLDLGLLLPALMAFIAGLVIHSFIIEANINDWWKGRSVTPVDHIVTSLGITRMCAQCAITLYMYVDAFTPKTLYSHVTLYIIDESYCVFCYANILLTSLLSIVLCLKISNLHTRLFLYLRRLILQKTMYFIVASLLLAALSSLSALDKIITEVTKGGAYNATNVTNDDISSDCSFISFLNNFAVETFFPVLFYYISSVLLFTSLYHHTTRMKMSSNLSINLETYYSVMRFLSITLMYNTIYFTVDIVCAFYYHVYCIDIHWLYIVFGFLPSLHSFYLIYRTAKLRDQMFKVLQNVIGFLFQWEDTETRENIEIVGE